MILITAIACIYIATHWLETGIPYALALALIAEVFFLLSAFNFLKRSEQGNQAKVDLVTTRHRMEIEALEKQLEEVKSDHADMGGELEALKKEKQQLQEERLTLRNLLADLKDSQAEKDRLIEEYEIKIRTLGK